MDLVEDIKSSNSRLFLEDILRVEYDEAYARELRGKVFDLMGQVDIVTASVPDMNGWELEDIEMSAKSYRNSLWKVARKFGIYASLSFDIDIPNDPRDIQMPWTIPWIQAFAKSFFDGDREDEEGRVQNWANVLQMLGPNDGLLLYFCARSATDSDVVTFDKDLEGWVFSPESLEIFENLWKQGKEFDS